MRKSFRAMVLDYTGGAGIRADISTGGAWVPLSHQEDLPFQILLRP